jgi:hypothetical protein
MAPPFQNDYIAWSYIDGDHHGEAYQILVSALVDAEPTFGAGTRTD